jgi:Copper type II ascorbate-dependent monooxygenase, C-terminal domain
MRNGLVKLVTGAVALASLGVVASMSSAGAAAHTTYPVTKITISMASPYKPAPPKGATDDYHCSLVNPNVKQDSFITQTNFNPGDKSSTEVHHAILFLIPPSWAAAAVTANNNGKGWTCFGETILTGQQLNLPGSPGAAGNPTWLTAWAPGHNLNTFPIGTGVRLPKGSLVVLQIHYNTLAGDAAIKSSLTLSTVPIADPLDALSLDLYPAPPDVPCLASWNPKTTPLCKRANSLKYLAARFGQDAVNFVNGLEFICGRNPNNPPQGDSTSCTWTNHRTARIVAIGAHMHLTGAQIKIVLNPGTAKQKTLVNVTNFNFDYQRGYDMKPWIQIKPGDRIKVSCTFNPKLTDELPQLRQTPRRFVTWGDGSSDEMCLGLVYTVAG